MRTGKGLERVLMLTGHHENEIGLSHEVAVQRLAEVRRDVDAKFGDNLGGDIGHVQAVQRAEARRGDLDVIAAPQHVAKHALRHRAAANVACANEENLLHRILTVCRLRADRAIRRASLPGQEHPDTL